ncbi:energy-coupling factor transporter transmembrane protein EcfT [Citreicella sp. C3M06]|uniref:energy-coupling factor transporter transmembrane component T family protein n=1 Tax=Citreicella sp. C3M06 TaxID=2841564 RepID=UPI001C0A181B|nr:energy-coupling factor transporter transmembrane protein EcfT [Citreicella sp. C3M06]MBU2963530.1 energy-coupling factor transporter transmembrane protein EcfT [Citreicella sp. C3M06]
MISLTSPVDTWAHRLPAGLKLAALSAATVGLFALPSPGALALACVAVLALILSCGWRFSRAAAASLRILLPFLALIALWHGLTGQIGEGIKVALRLMAALSLANFVTMTTRLTDMIAVASAVLAPLRRFGLSTRALELSVALVVRFTPAIARKGGLLSDAWRARSRRRAGWRIVMPLAALAIDDAEQVAEALRARGGLEPPDLNP